MTNIRNLRKAAGLTQVQLSRRAGVTQQCISYLESPRAQRGRRVTLLKLALALGVDPAQLVDPEGAKDVAA